MSERAASCAAFNSMFRRFALLILLFLVACHVYAKSDATDIPSDIHEFFPTATRVGETHADIQVTPVYQLQDLLGYVFESNDFVDFIGFSGKPVNVLIGLDTEGNFVGLKVKQHSEPIFLHGLGEQSMFDFIAQYLSHNIRERFIVGGKSKAGSDATYFDGVTKATVSVLVINDTIVTSALAVARAKLDGFVAPSTKIVNPDFFEPLNFNELVEKGYVQKHLLLSSHFEGVESEIVAAAAPFINAENDVFSEHYYAFLNIPTVGRNLLGEQEFKRLQENLNPGELALMVFNTKGFSFISEDFVSQTAPEFLRLSQGDFPLSIRDIDFYSFYEPEFSQPLPDFNDIKVLRVKAKGGLSLDQPITISIALPYNPSFFEQEEHLLPYSFTLPPQLFIENPEAIAETPLPLWQKIWLDKTLEISITVAYLFGLSVFFAFQRRLTKYTLCIRIIRLTSLLFILFFIGFYAQGQLSVVNIYTLLLDIVDGFSLGVYLLDPVIFILWCFVFISLFVVGRGLYCGWLCPFGALQEMLAIIAEKLKIKQIRVKPHHHKRAQKIKYVLLLGLVGCAFYSLTLAEKLAELEPFKTAITLHFVRYWPFVLYAIAILALSLKIHKVYCRYLCPLGAGLAVLGRFPIVKLLRRRQECGAPCQLCRQKKCGIDAIEMDGSIDYAECIQCLECVVTLDNPEMCKIDKYKKKRVPTRVKNVNIISAK